MLVREITYWLIFSPHSQNNKWLRTLMDKTANKGQIIE
jgi:hypothetical protein